MVILDMAFSFWLALRTLNIPESGRNRTPPGEPGERVNLKTAKIYNIRATDWQGEKPE
jgi:hypothetical protein